MIAGLTLQEIRTGAAVLQVIIFAIGTAGVWVTWKQVKFTKRQVELRREQLTTDFENQLTREYRDISKEIPVNALLGDELSPYQQQRHMREFYSYIDLSNEQTFLRYEGNVSAETWDNWADGIKSHMEREAFQKAWIEIKRRSGDNFKELRKLESRNYDSDPFEWKTIELEPDINE